MAVLPASPLEVATAPRPAGRSWTAARALALLAVAVAYSSATRTVFSPLQELAKAGLGLSDVELSLVQGLALSIPLALLSLPIGRLADRWHRVRLLMGMAAVSLLGTLLTAVAPGFGVLFIARMLAGLGAAGAIPIAISIAADLSPPEHRGRSILYLSVGNITGVALAFALGGWLLGLLTKAPATALFGGTAPWRGVHAEFAAAGLLVILCLLAVREPPRHEMGESAGAPLRVALHALWVRRALLGPLFLGQVTVVMADNAAAVWAAPVLSRNFHQRPEDFAGWMGLVILLAGIVGSAIGGFAADRGQRRPGSGGLLAGAVVAAAVSIPSACYPLMPSVPGFAVVLEVFLLSGAVTGLITATAIAVLVPNELRGVCLGAFMVVGGVIGFGVAPTLVSLASLAMGGEGHLAGALSAVGVGTSVLALAGFLGAARTIRARGASPAP